MCFPPWWIAAGVSLHCGGKFCSGPTSAVGSGWESREISVPLLKKRERRRKEREKNGSKKEKKRKREKNERKKYREKREKRIFKNVLND